MHLIGVLSSHPYFGKKSIVFWFSSPVQWADGENQDMETPPRLLPGLNRSFGQNMLKTPSPPLLLEFPPSSVPMSISPHSLLSRRRKPALLLRPSTKAASTPGTKLTLLSSGMPTAMLDGGNWSLLVPSGVDR